MIEELLGIVEMNNKEDRLANLCTDKTKRHHQYGLESGPNHMGCSKDTRQHPFFIEFKCNGVAEIKMVTPCDICNSCEVIEKYVSSVTQVAHKYGLETSSNPIVVRDRQGYSTRF
jgi:hypothetical protein